MNFTRMEVTAVDEVGRHRLSYQASPIGFDLRPAEAEEYLALCAELGRAPKLRTVQPERITQAKPKLGRPESPYRVAPGKPLSTLQSEVLRLYRKALTVGEVAKRLGISECGAKLCRAELKAAGFAFPDSLKSDHREHLRDVVRVALRAMRGGKTLDQAARRVWIRPKRLQQMIERYKGIDWS